MSIKFLLNTCKFIVKIKFIVLAINSFIYSALTNVFLQKHWKRNIKKKIKLIERSWLDYPILFFYNIHEGTSIIDSVNLIYILHLM